MALGTLAAVSRDPHLNGLSHPDNQPLSAFCPLLPPGKGPLLKASFEMRIQGDRDKGPVTRVPVTDKSFSFGGFGGLTIRRSRELHGRDQRLSLSLGVSLQVTGAGLSFPPHTRNAKVAF